VVGGIHVSNGIIIVTGTNGAAGANYYLLETTNLALPASSWTVLSTNQFSADGSFSLTIFSNSNWPQAFYRLCQP
jgi:hypothetical protein